MAWEKTISTGGGQLTGNLTLYAPNGNSPYLMFQRGTIGDSYNDWRIQDRSGYLYFEDMGSGGNWTQHVCMKQDAILVFGDLNVENNTITTKSLKASSMKGDAIAYECNPSGIFESGYRSEINRFGGDLYLQERGNLANGNATQNVYMCSNGGNVAIGATATSDKLYVNGTIQGSDTISCTNGFYQSSDARLKDNVETISKDTAKDVIMATNPVTFTWKKDGSKGQGVIAQEFEKVLPEAVGGGNNSYKSVDYQSLIPYLVKIVQVQQEEIAELKERINNLEKQ